MLKYQFNIENLKRNKIKFNIIVYDSNISPMHYYCTIILQIMHL